MIRNIKAKIRTFFDYLRATFADLSDTALLIVYSKAEMEAVKRAHGLSHLTDEQAAQVIFDDLTKDRRNKSRTV